MHTEFKNLIQLFDYFDTESKCIEYLEKQRWNGEPTCPHCGHGRPYCTIRKRVNSRNKTVKTKGYKCSNKECRKKFSVLVGTIFENSKIPLRTWFGAIYIATAHKKGVSSLQLSRDLNITQKSAWFVLHRIREMLTDKNPDLLEGMVEIDETYVGGKDKNKHAQHRTSNKWEGDKKIPVLGIVQRGGRLRHTVIKDSKSESVNPVVYANVKLGSTMVTDERQGYKSLRKQYRHIYVTHRNFEYVRDQWHTNTIEGSFSLLKRGIFGIYHQVSAKHLQRYCDEFAYRYNSRKQKDTDRFSYVLTHTEGRLKYKDLTFNESDHHDKN